MKKKFMAVVIAFHFFSLFAAIGYASGGVTHMLLAQETIALVPDPQLRNLLQNHLDAYLVGAYYPDSGYVGGNHYGEDSHWDPFIYAFADYIKASYTDPVVQNPKLVAFLFGCATHRVSDEIAHWTFYPLVSKNDFNRDWDWDPTIHQYGDLGIDMLINIDKDQWLTPPTTWWVPVSDLVKVYHRMGKEYTAEEIIWGNQLIYYAGYGERLISPFVYPYLRWKLPWTSQHYYDWPDGGIAMSEKKIVTYLLALWTRLNTKQSPVKGTTPYSPSRLSYLAQHGDTVTTAFTKKALENGYMDVSLIHNPDGSVEIQPPIIRSFINYERLLIEGGMKLTGQI